MYLNSLELPVFRVKPGFICFILSSYGASYFSFFNFHPGPFILRGLLINVRAVQKYGPPEGVLLIGTPLALYLAFLYYVSALHCKLQS
jgi:hypothetical protein